MATISGKNVQNPKGGRPAIEIHKETFLRLYNEGLADQIIAQNLGISRQTVIRFRESMGLKPNRKRGERGPGKVREDKSYYQEVKRVMRIPEVAREIYKAAKIYRRAGGDEATSYVATVIDPAPTPRVIPGPWCSPADKINLTQVKYIVTVEQQAERTGIAGVPGPAVFELAEVVKTGSERLIRKLAMAAVMQAFMVGVNETVKKVTSKIGPVHLSRRALSVLRDTWERVKNQCLAWAPVQEESKKRFTFRVMGERPALTGKVGRQGGRWSLEARRAFAGANGY